MRDILLFIFVLSISSCSSPLERKYIPGRYIQDYKELVSSEAVTDHEMFLINYTILRATEYNGYSVEGKNFNEILHLGKTYEANGLGINYEFTTDGSMEPIVCKLRNDGLAQVRLGETSKLKKVLNFNGTFENTSSKEVFLETATFQFYGPFKDHLTSVMYKINVLFKPGEKKSINFYADGKNISNNVKYKADDRIAITRIDDILLLSEIKFAGSKTSLKAPMYIEERDFNKGRFPPTKAFTYYKELKDTTWIKKDQNGKVSKLYLGPAILK